ncbi:MAG: invasion associated locus B family protein [Bradyrhizobium sp.]|nr:invasion associated locus B family protein [Bradyrhizobium sp.]
MKIIGKLAVLAAAIVLGWVGQVAAQAPKGKAAPPAPAPQAQSAPAQPADANAPPQPGWVARCASVSRDAPLECAVEETAVLTKTGQLIVLVNIRVTSDTRTPVALVQLPLGLNLPAGARLQVDDGKSVDLQIQTCENRGCYANLPIAPDMLAAMRAGKLLKVSFQNLSKDPITIPLPLTDFAPAYDKIK